MFKKDFKSLKNQVPLRASDLKRLRQALIDRFQLSNEDGELLVPSGLLAAKFMTNADVAGMGYFDSQGTPLWFHSGTSSTVYGSFVPTVYTLWKRVFLPIVTTPQLVVDKMKQGADLMAPGVVAIHPSHTAPLPLSAGQLVCVVPYSGSLQGIPLAVGTMNMSSTEIATSDKGKAVLTFHTYGDSLWEKGGKREPPKEVTMVQAISTVAGSEDVEPNAEQERHIANTQKDIQETKESEEDLPQGSSNTQDSTSSDEVDRVLRDAALFCLHATASSIVLPCSASAFYADSILPFRPAGVDPSVYVIKNSSFKKLKPFIKALEKEAILKTKDMGGELHLMAIDPTHPDVQGAVKYRTLADQERKEANARAIEESQAASAKAIIVTELYKPVGPVVPLCKAISPDPHLTIVELRDEILSKYIAQHNLVHPAERAYFKIDGTLKPILLKKNENQEFLKRDEGLQRLVAACQAWYQIEQEGRSPELRKGKLHPVSITIKMRQGKKAVTLITNFEPFYLVADSVCEDLRKLCAAQSSVSPLQGKVNQLEVMVQGKQAKIVTDYLLERGVPKKWIEFEDTTEKKKGK